MVRRRRRSVTLATQGIVYTEEYQSLRIVSRLYDSEHQHPTSREVTSVAIPQFMKKIHKSFYGTVRFTVPATWRFTCAHAHIGGEQEEHCCSRCAGSGVIPQTAKNEGKFYCITKNTRSSWTNEGIFSLYARSR
uniref:Uncharacterized protein n=1 Tax=Timema douglasi TaxID=61478 RepID=A0A7R8VVT1_TIMDO|nr:unnamed protein product [Timema douglasi]